MSDETLLEFPCDFPVKIMGRDSQSFRDMVVDIVTRHAGETPATTRPSRDGRYVSMSFTIHATSRAQLDALYCELSANDDVLFVL